MTSMFPDPTRPPYYIVTPNYDHASGGVRCLHLLCHWLNRSGERAYVIATGGSSRPVDLHLLTPLLSPEIAIAHAEATSPIIVYPEVVSGNPLNAENVVRYVLNTPGRIGGDTSYAPEELIIGYAAEFVSAFGASTPILHLPTVDERVFHPGKPGPRKGSAFYAYKYRDMHGNAVFGLPEGAVEITKGRPDSQTPAQIAAIFRSVETFYAFEPTALSLEAILCGCAVVQMPSAYMSAPPCLAESGADGLAWGDAPEEIARAKATVPKAQQTYRRRVDVFFEQLRNFIDLTQAKALQTRLRKLATSSAPEPARASLSLG